MNPVSQNPVTDALCLLLANQKRFDKQGIRWLIKEKSFDVDKIVNLLLATFGLLNKIDVKTALPSGEITLTAYTKRLKHLKIVKTRLKQNLPLQDLIQSILEQQSYYSSQDPQKFEYFEIALYLKRTPMPLQFAKRLGSDAIEEVRLEVQKEEQRINNASQKLLKGFSGESTESLNAQEWLEAEIVWSKSAAYITVGKYINWIKLVEEWAKSDPAAKEASAGFLQSLRLCNLLTPNTSLEVQSPFTFPKNLPSSCPKFPLFLLKRTLEATLENVQLNLGDILKKPQASSIIEKLKSAFVTNEEMRKTINYLSYILGKRFLMTMNDPNRFEIFAWTLYDKYSISSQTIFASFLQAIILTLIYRQHLFLKSHMDPEFLFASLLLCSKEQTITLKQLVHSFAASTLTSKLGKKEGNPESFSQHLEACIETIRKLYGESTYSQQEFIEWLIALLKVKNPNFMLELIRKLKDDDNIEFPLSFYKELLKASHSRSSVVCEIDAILLTILELREKFKYSPSTPEEEYKFIRALSSLNEPYRLTELLLELKRTCRYNIEAKFIFNVALLFEDKKIDLKEFNFELLIRWISSVMKNTFHKKSSQLEKIRVFASNDSSKRTVETVTLFENKIKTLSSCTEFTPKEEERFLIAYIQYTDGAFTLAHEKRIHKLCEELTLVLSVDDWIDLIAAPFNLQEPEISYSDMIPTFQTMKKLKLPPSKLILLCFESIGKDTNSTTNSEAISFQQHLIFLELLSMYIGAPLDYDMIFLILKDHPLTSRGFTILKELQDLRKEITSSRNLSLFCLDYPLVEKITTTVNALQQPDMLTNDDPSILFSAVNLVLLSTLSSNIQLFSDFMPTQITKGAMVFDPHKNTRSHGLLRRMRPVQTAARDGKGALCFWTLTRKGFYRFTLVLLKQLDAPEARMVTSTLEIPITMLEKDPKLCQFLYDMVLDMSCEVIDPRPQNWCLPDSFDSEYSEFIFWLKLYPNTFQKWDSYLPVNGNKREIGAKLFLFVKTLKTKFRQANCEISTSQCSAKSQEDPFLYICDGHVYEADKAISLIPPNHPKNKQAEFKVRFLEQESIFKQIEIAMSKDARHEFQLTTTFATTKKSAANLHVKVEVVPILEGSFPYCQVNMSLNHNDKTIDYLLTYQPGFYGPPYFRLLQFQLLMLKREFYLKTFFPDF